MMACSFEGGCGKVEVMAVFAADLTVAQPTSWLLLRIGCLKGVWYCRVISCQQPSGWTGQDKTCLGYVFHG